MKRGHEPSTSITEKISKLAPSSRDFLNTLDDDCFKLVIRLLDTQSKGNLKRTSKNNEKRVMSVDPIMRSWNIRFGKNQDWIRKGILLSKAWLRHSLDGTIANIKLSVDLSQSSFSFSFLYLAESVINRWKDNIVHLEMMISGFEFFLLNSDMKMSQLKSLTLEEWDPDWNEEIHHSFPNSESSFIVSKLLEQHKETLEKLELNTLDVFIPETLNLKEFQAKNISLASVVHLFKHSQFTLKKFECQSLLEVDEEINDIECLKLQLTDFKATRTHDLFVAAVINNSHLSLKHLYLEHGILDDLITHDGFGLKSIQLNLETFNANYLPFSIVSSVVNASKSSLQDLSIKEVKKEDYRILFQDINPFKLTSFSAIGTSTETVAAVIQSSHSTLEKLSVESIENYVNELGSLRLDKLKEFYAFYCPKEIALAVIKSSHLSLELLELKELRMSTFFFNLNLDRLHLKKFFGERISMEVVAAVLNLSHLSLEHLELVKLKTTINEEGCQIDELNLKSFRGYDIPASVVTTILKSSHSSIFNVLYLKNIINETGIFDSEMSRMLMQIQPKNPFGLLHF